MVAIELFDFQTQAASQMSEAIEEWIQAYAKEGPRYIGRTPIPFIGHLKAVTGAGKTPILTKVVGDLLNAVVLWTSKQSAVADQTYRNLTGKYAHLLPPGTTVVRERPSKSDWENLVEAQHGITIWVSTVGSWNEAEAAETSGSETARLNMHRPHPDWGGETSPWDQLRRLLNRPLWVVYDESHNQTPTQLDQLTGLGPIGFLLASATPPEGGQFEKYALVVKDDETLKPIAEKGRVRVPTQDVVANHLLKHTIQVENFDADPDSLLDASLDLHRRLTAAAEAGDLPIQPKALYVVERSNPGRGETTSRPLAIWDYLRDRGVEPENIAVYTQTKVLPDEAVRVTALSELQPWHTHIICNRALQEGWDDPEAYVEYFDDESSSYIRIAQVIGRALRQPGAQHYQEDLLNTATLFVRVPNRTFNEIVESLKKELSLYATDASDPYGSSAIRVRTKREPLDPVPVRSEFVGTLSLPQYQLGEANLTEEVSKVQAQSRSPFDPQDLTAAGQRSIRKLSLRGEEDTTRYELIAASMRRKNGEYLRRRIQVRSRHCAHLLEPDLFAGPAFDQWSCAGSAAQALLSERANAIVQAFESTVELVPVGIHGEETWTPGPHQPSSSNFESFTRSVHARYARNGFNSEELEFAKALDSLGAGHWMRNPSRGDGYGVTMPMKVGDSTTFYPDFLWWVNDDCYAIDPTGAHILDGKIRGKLLNIDLPKIVLIAKGHVTADWLTKEDTDDYTVVRPRKNQAARPEYFSSLVGALKHIAGL